VDELDPGSLLAGLRARQREQRAPHACEPVALALDVADEEVALVGQLLRPRLQDLDRRRDRREGRPELVRRVRDELALGPLPSLARGDVLEAHQRADARSGEVEDRGGGHLHEELLASGLDPDPLAERGLPVHDGAAQGPARGRKGVAAVGGEASEVVDRRQHAQQTDGGRVLPRDAPFCVREHDRGGEVVEHDAKPGLLRLERPARLFERGPLEAEAPVRDAQLLHARLEGVERLVQDGAGLGPGAEALAQELQLACERIEPARPPPRRLGRRRRALHRLSMLP
jgi:hypothetical protein